MTKAVFLDRDGVLIEDTGFVGAPEAVRLLPGVGAALNELHKRGFLVIVVSNQSGVARGMFSEADVAAVNAEMRRRLALESASVDDIYICPHHPRGSAPAYTCECECRKPRPGMIIAAAAEHGIDLGNSYMIGDAPRDIEAGISAGCRQSIYIGSPVVGEAGGYPTAKDLREAVEKIIE